MARFDDCRKFFQSLMFCGNKGKAQQTKAVSTQTPTPEYTMQTSTCTDRHRETTAATKMGRTGLFG